MSRSSRTTRTRALGLALVAGLVWLGCSARQEHRPPRTSDVTVRILSQSCFQGEVVPCG